MSQTITIEDRLRKFLRDRERLNHQLQTGEITADTYAQRIEEMRQVNTGPMPLASIVENIEYHANCMKSALFNAGMAIAQIRLSVPQASAELPEFSAPS